MAPGRPEQAVTILRDGVAVGAARFALDNFEAFAAFLNSLGVAWRPDDETCRRLLALFIEEIGNEVVADALICAAFMQKPEAE